MTLTSSNESPDRCQRSFRALYMRLKRRHLIKGYIKVPEFSKNGKQHLHVLFRGSYIEQALISAWWQEIHHAKVVDIRRVNYSKSPRRVASYLAKYMSKENAFRYSWNWDWVWRGFCRDWAHLKRSIAQMKAMGVHIPFPTILMAWRMWLREKWKPDFDDLFLNLNALFSKFGKTVQMFYYPDESWKLKGV